jgi:DNA invertase Pin-like site-specific DNA recombinase
MNSPRAIGIVRVSQRDNDSGQSPEVQRRALGRMTELHGWSLAADDVLDENVDNGGRVRQKSGGADLADRLKLRWAVEEIEAGHAGVLAAENFDRLFRNIDVQRSVIQRVETAGGEGWRKDGRVSIRRALPKFVSGIEGLTNEYVKDAAEERSWDAVEIAIEQGKVPWPKIPPGLLRNDDGTVRPDPNLAATVRRAFNMRARRHAATIAEVRDYLRSRGIERSYHGVTKMLGDRIYVGEIHFGTHTPNLKAYEPPVVDRDLFDRVQRQVVPRGRRSSSPRLLARLARVEKDARDPILRCASCGCGMVMGTQRQNGRSYPFYRCPNSGKGDDCPQRMAIGAELAEAAVVDAVKAALADAEGRASAKTEAREAAEAADEAQANYRNALAVLKDFGDEAAVAKLRDLKAEAESARERAERLGGRKAAVTVNAAKDWDRLTLEEQREIVKATVESATVNPGRGRDRVTVRLFGD